MDDMLVEELDVHLLFGFLHKPLGDEDPVDVILACVLLNGLQLSCVQGRILDRSAEVRTGYVGENREDGFWAMANENEALIGDVPVKDVIVHALGEMH